MCRRSNFLLSFLACLLLVASARGDEVATYLQRLGLKPLLAIHLEQQLAAVKGEQRDLMVRQLADLYADLLASVEDPRQRKKLEDRGRALVNSLPEQQAGSLRLALLRGSFRVAERIAEDHRLRLSDEAEIEKAIQILTEIIPKFNNLLKHLETNIEQFERRLARASSLAASNLFNEIERARARFDEATFYYAWALYYQSWLNERRDNAMIAIRQFAGLLDLETFNPDPNDVSVDLRSLEPIARSILGIALCKSITSSGATAVNWISLLDHENTYKPLRDEAPIWRIALWLEQDEFTRAREELDLFLKSDRRMPSPWLRLIAVQALERGANNRQAEALVRYAVTELASRDALDQVLDLAQRYGTDSLGDRGFALRYVRGVMTYSETRNKHGSDGPTTNPALNEQYAQATTTLEAALGENDVDQYSEAAAACRRLIGYCHYFQGHYLLAKDSFVLAASEMGRNDEAAEALWMAIVCLDKVAHNDRTDQLMSELNGLMNRFLREYPSSEYTPKIMLKRALASRRADVEVVETLLEIPENSEVYPAARLRAMQVLYQLFRESKGELRYAHGRRFVDITLPLMKADLRRLGSADAPNVKDMVTRARMLLEISLSVGVMRRQAARQTFAWLDELLDEHEADLAPFHDELSYRRLLEQMSNGNLADAGALADELWKNEESSIWSRLASRAMFNDANRRWRQLSSADEVDVALLRIIDRFGGRILIETAGDDEALERPAVLAYHATVAEADWLLWNQTRDELRGRAALALYEKLRRSRPNNAGFLRATALLSEEFDQYDQALNCWRLLLAGTDARSNSWFESKFHQINMLIKLERYALAQEVLKQHVLLNSGHGPDPWGARLKGLEVRLQMVQPAALNEHGDEAGDP